MLSFSRRALTHAFPRSLYLTRRFNNSTILKMKEKPIVSSFICTSPESEGGLKFALFKRSTKVSTYKRKWAVCSGSIEENDPTPELAARREIEEETQLTSDDISLYRTGKAFKLVDTDLDITWIIHTFSFLLNDPNKKLVIESEHTEYKFIKPEELKKQDHVPALEEGMRRVLPGPVITDGLNQLRDDHDNGAEVLAMTALKTLKEAIDGADFANAKSAEEFWKELRLAAWMLGKNGRPDMRPAIEGALSKALLAIAGGVAQRGGNCFEKEKLNAFGLEDMKSAAKEGIEEIMEVRRMRMQSLSSSFVELVAASEPYQWRIGRENAAINILTLSYSSSVTKALKKLIARAREDSTNIYLKILESRPRFDGVAFVKDLFNLPLDQSGDGMNHVKVDILSDACVALAAKHCDLVVIGTDKLSAEGDVSNKVGSFPVCLLAKTLQPKSKIVVIATTDKITSIHEKELVEEPKDYGAHEMTQSYPNELATMLTKVAHIHGAKVRVKNPYFEWVPAKWVDVYVTEEGVMDRSHLKGYAQRKLDLEQKLFEGV